MTTASDRLQTYTRDMLPRFSENLDLVRRAFEIDVLEVFVARERFLGVQEQALDVWRDYILAVRDWELAAGQELAGGAR